MSPKVSDAYKEERRQSILDVALRCFAEKGYGSTTVDDIAAGLGVSKGVVYLYFAGKEELYKQVMEERMQQSITGMKKRFRPEDGAENKLRQVFHAFRNQSLPELKRLLAFYLEFWLESSRREDLKAVMDRQSTYAEDFIASIVEEGIRSGEFRPDADPADFSALFWATRDGIALQFVGGGEDADYRKRMEAMERTLLGSLLQSGK
ncbi:TetR/AcrR family transcriptional regulator [Gorillibacterium timonense]|uniref:TetR/AcrR family transcriptional regulator n=1 Tax=Gorillibacterium timonense TaxID=1689269 RepID=UPI00071CC779|nr:TetR/AcrR family transcriptional regulator [Gorillibacterium timonense]